MESYAQFDDKWEDNARLIFDTLAFKPTDGIPILWVNVMDIPFMEEMTGNPAGAYARDPETVYLAFQQAAGVCAIDQYIPENPGTMCDTGFESATPRTATTGAGHPVCDGVVIDSPEAVAEHLERFVFPRLEQAIGACQPQDGARVAQLIAGECATQRRFGPGILKIPYGEEFAMLPQLRYGQYGYEQYLMAYACYPELIERDFALQADWAERWNTVGTRAVLEGGLPPLIRSDHDMADSRGTLVDVRSLDRIWFPHFARSIRPLLDAGIRVIWHCDGNLMAMVPRLIEAGVSGFQGFQYEAGMDYERICRMKDREGGPLLIWAGVSVTRTLPFGTPQDVKDELAWLVRCGPATGLMLGASSSVTPGTNHATIRAMIEGFHYYRHYGRG